jgi:hypothetical protein
LSRLSLYAVALRFPFTGTEGPSPNHEKQPQTIIPPSPNFTIGIRQTLLQRRRFHCSRVQWRQALHHSSRHLALHTVILGYSAMETHFMKLQTNSYCPDIASRVSLELCSSECCNWEQMIYMHYVCQHSPVPFCALVWPTTLRLSRCCS